MQFIQFTAARADTGQVLPYAKVTVYLTGTMTPTSLFDAGGGSISNPLVADSVGLVGFSAVNGTYDLNIQSADGVYTFPGMIKVQLFDVAAVASALAGAIVAGIISKVYSTKAGLVADLAAAANTLGLVYADPTTTNNDIYVKVGGSGSGSWTGPLDILGSARSAASAAAAAASAIAAANTAAGLGLLASRIKDDAPSGWLTVFTDQTGQFPGGITDQGVLQFSAIQALISLALGSNGEAFSPSSGGMLGGVRDQSGHFAFAVDENGVSHMGAVQALSLNGTSAGGIARLLGEAPLTIGPATRYLSVLNGQSLANGDGATADPFTNAGAVALTTDQPYGNKMFHGGVRPDDINGLASGTFDLTSLVPHIEAALTSVGDPTGAGETALGGFQAMLFQLLNAYGGLAPIDVPFSLISFAPGQGGDPIVDFRSGSVLFTRFMSCVTAGKTLSSGQNVQMPWHLWMQGESGQKDDGYIAQLTGLAAEVDSSTRAILTQQTDPVITFTYQLDRAQAAHWYIEAAKASALIRIVGPMYPFVVAGMRGSQFDTVHRQASAYHLYGATAAVAVFCHYFLKRPWRPLQLSFNARGNLRCRVDGSDLIVTYDVPHGGALAFDTPGIDLTGAGPTILVAGGLRWASQRGFYMFNSGGTEKPLSDVRLESRNQVRLAGASPVAGDVLRVGYKDDTLDQPESVIVNLRDCQGDVITFDDGGKVPIHNWALGEEHTLTSAELS